MTAYLDLADYLLIAEAVTGIDAAVLAKASRIELAESALNAPRAEFDGVEFYRSSSPKRPSSAPDWPGTIRFPTATNGPPGCHCGNSVPETAIASLPGQSMTQSSRWRAWRHTTSMKPNW